MSACLSDSDHQFAFTHLSPDILWSGFIKHFPVPNEYFIHFCDICKLWSQSFTMQTIDVRLEGIHIELTTSYGQSLLLLVIFSNPHWIGRSRVKSPFLPFFYNSSICSRCSWVIEELWVQLLAISPPGNPAGVQSLPFTKLTDLSSIVIVTLTPIWLNACVFNPFVVELAIRVIDFNFVIDQVLVND